jgi:hypothetical protein
MGVASGAGTDYHSGAPEVTLSCKCGSCSSILFFLCSVLQIVVCLFFLLAIVLSVLLLTIVLSVLLLAIVLSVLLLAIVLSVLLLAIVLPVLRFADSDYPFGVFKLFLSNNL